MAADAAAAAVRGLAVGFLFGRTNGSATLGRRMIRGGAPFGAVGVRVVEVFAGEVMFSKGVSLEVQTEKL